ncbi:MAG: SDR family oxidoreductase [Acidobacteria bacterium]|nr:SDR family oxidoreductase [Acidobacteriota bacterium]
MWTALKIQVERTLHRANTQVQDPPTVYWRVEGSLLNLSAVRQIAFFTWNAQSIAERWARRGGLAAIALIRLFLYFADRAFATRVIHALLRGVSNDRLDLLGEEYFDYVLRPQLKPAGLDRLKAMLATGKQVILVSQALDHVMRPLAGFVGAEGIVANRLEFRDGLATGRLLEPIIRPRAGLALLLQRSADGQVSPVELQRELGSSLNSGGLQAATLSSRREVAGTGHPVVLFKPGPKLEEFSVREILKGRHILLIGATGFIGKVWLVKLLTDLPEIGRVYLLIRPGKTASAQERFEKMVEESPVFDHLHERYGSDFWRFLRDRIEVVPGDVTRDDLGLDPFTAGRLHGVVDLVVNSSGLTDFNPDLRQALSSNVEATIHLVDFLKTSSRAALLHLSTCFVVGSRDGQVREELIPDYTPISLPGFDVERERLALNDLIRETEIRSESEEVTTLLRKELAARSSGSAHATGATVESHLRKYRTRWVRNEMMEVGMRRAKALGWPNTYTFTKSLAESLIARWAADLPVAVVRPSIVETSTGEPFAGWNEGVNTSAPLSYLLGTRFRQLPSNKRKCLDLIPVDLVSRGMTLIAASLIERSHERVYHLATSACNPCDMRRSIELTCLAHRKFYRTQVDRESQLLAKLDTIPVSKARYQRLSAPKQRAVLRALQRVSAPIPFARQPLARRERSLDRVEKLIELYEPFILHNQHVFEARHVQLLALALPQDERSIFGYDPLNIDWWDYWINVHIPALRIWSYPLIEGRPLESRSRHSLRQVVQSEVGAAAGRPGGAGE